MTGFSDRVRAAADEQGRLPLPAQAMWEIFPFEPASLVVKPLDPDVVPEPPRGGEGDRATGPAGAAPTPTPAWSGATSAGCSRGWTSSCGCRSPRC